MQASKSKYVKLESISLPDLFKQPAGSVGIYILEDKQIDPKFSNEQRLASFANATASRQGKKSAANTLLCIDGVSSGFNPSMFKIVQIEVLERES